ncbi:MAG TPA: YdcF family protein [Alphaproteobacteria bacterium]|nr:YdcF family protein [Alphaproteobacteria bacterium]
MIFFLSKALWILVQPSNLLLLAACIGAALLFTRWAKAGRIALTAALGLCLLVAALPVGNWMIYPLETRFPVPDDLGKVDGIIVLSGAFNAKNSAYRGAPVLNQYAQRFTTFMELARRYPEAKLLFSGGAVFPMHNGVTESDIGRWFFAAQGLDVQRILFEDKSRNTHENVMYSKQIAQPKPGEHWVLVTSAAHMPRSVGLFRKNGWNVTPYPAGYATMPFLETPRGVDFGGRLERLDDAVKEWTGLVAYYVLGRTSAIFPAPE